MTDEGSVPPQPDLPPMPAAPAPTGGDFGFGSTDQRPAGLSTGPIRARGGMESGSRRQGGILMMAGAALVLVSLPLPLYAATGPGFSGSFNQMNSAAIWPLFICVFAFLRGYSTVKPIAFRSSLPLLSGIFIVWAGYDRWSWIADLRLRQPAFTISPGIGFVIFCMGGALIVVGSVILQFVKPGSR